MPLCVNEFILKALLLVCFIDPDGVRRVVNIPGVQGFFHLPVREKQLDFIFVLLYVLKTSEGFFF